MRIVTGFHAIEEELRAIEDAGNGKKDGPKAGEKSTAGVRIEFAKPGPRVKKIIAAATALGIPSKEAAAEALDTLVKTLPPTARDHRGVVMVMENAEAIAPLRLEDAVAELKTKDNALVVVLDSITDPHNVGAIIRSADQFGVDLVILPEHRGATDFEVISRTSAGASSWVPTVLVTNLVRAVEALKDAGFWVYGADAGGTSAPTVRIAEKAVLVMGSEGSGIARLLREKCDEIVSIPTHGRLDSLNVSVAAGVLLYEIRRPRQD
jgi:23S rRNA (guanosine2251-2'-O)-methyltransferase